MANLIGTGLNQVPTNGMLGNMAFQSKEAVTMDLLGVSGNLIVNGRIGLGTNAPDYPFVVLSSTATPTAWFKHTGGTDSSIILGDPSTISNECGIYGRTTGAFNFVNATGGRFVWKNTSGTEYMRLDASGNVGIGTSAPGYRLEAYRAGAASIVAARSDTQAVLRAEAGSVAVDVNVTTSIGEVRTATNHPLLFSTNSTERMRIDASGNLGLGVTPRTTTATYRAFEFGQSGYLAAVASGPGITLGSNYYIASGAVSTYSTNGAATYYGQISGAHQWFNAPSGTAGNAITFTQAMTLNASGNLLVGNTAQWSSERFGITGSSASQRFMYARTTANGHYLSLGTNGTLPYLEYGNGSGLAFSDGATERMRITSAGNVGIGTGTPVYKLDVATISVATSQSGGVRFGPSDAFGLRLLQNSDAGGVPYSQIAGPKDANSWMSFHLGATDQERMRINNSGYLGIGTNSPTSKVMIVGTSDNLDATVQIVGSGVSTLLLGQNASGGIIRGQGGSNALSFWTGGSANTAAGGSGSEKMRITNEGNIQLGTASLATNAVNGFPYIPTCAGTPTGTPTAITGYAPMVVDSTNNKLYVYVGGAWQAMN